MHFFHPNVSRQILLTFEVQFNCTGQVNGAQLVLKCKTFQFQHMDLLACFLKTYYTFLLNFANSLLRFLATKW